MSRFTLKPVSMMALLLGAWLFASPSFATDFLRGDVNEDGQVSISDAYRLLSWLFRGGDFPACEKTADVNDNGSVNLSDSIQTLQFIHSGAEGPVNPYPNIGTDQTPDELGCESYGGGLPLEDLQAEIRIAAFVFNIDNDDVLPGNNELEEGGISGAGVFSFVGSCGNIPPNVPTETLLFELEILESASFGMTEMRFVDGAQWQDTDIGIDNLTSHSASRSFRKSPTRMFTLTANSI